MENTVRMKMEMRARMEMTVKTKKAMRMVMEMRMRIGNAVRTKEATRMKTEMKMRTKTEDTPSTKKTTKVRTELDDEDPLPLCSPPLPPPPFLTCAAASTPARN